MLSSHISAILKSLCAFKSTTGPLDENIFTQNCHTAQITVNPPGKHVVNFVYGS